MKDANDSGFVADAHYDDIFDGFVKYLWWMGYSISDSEGNETYSQFVFGDRFGVLCKDPVPKVWKLFWVIPIKLPTRRLFLGTFYAGRGACSGQCYIHFKINGQKYFKFAEGLASKINQTFGTNVRCLVGSKEPVRENKWNFW